jgi:hypothetical protein
VANIDIADAQAWAEAIKLPISALDANLEHSVAVTALAKLAVAFDTTSWISPGTTPDIVQQIIGMEYVAGYINRSQSSEEDLNEYALWLWANGEALIEGLIAGTLVIDPTDSTPEDVSSPLYYPTDASSAQEPNPDDMSLGGPAFTMGVIW